MTYKICHLDIETYSSTNIADGVHKYSSAKDFYIQLLCVEYEGEYIMVDLHKSGELPKRVNDILKDKNIIKAAHNARFEQQCFKAAGIEVNGKWLCTMVMCLAFNLPDQLGKVTELLGLETKIGEGKSLISYFSKPYGKDQVQKMPEDYPKKWENYRQYNKQDVVAEKELFDYLFDRVCPEWALWELDSKICEKGIPLDIPFINKVIELNDKHIAELMTLSREITKLDNPNSLVKLKEWLSDKIHIDSLTKSDVEMLLSMDLDDDIRTVLECRKASSNNSISKFYKMRDMAIDGHMYDCLRFYKASTTGRWAGTGAQIHNFPRVYLTPEQVTEYKGLVMSGINPDEVIGDNILKQLLRPAISCKEGETFIVSDFSAIEARVLAWIANEKWVLDIFRGDGKIYEAMASRMYNVPMDKVDKTLRAKGKVATLALGYQGSINALRAMGFDGTDEEAQSIVDLYRSTNSNISNLWYAVNQAAIRSIKHKSVEEVNYLKFHTGDQLFITLPSGRQLVYHEPSIVDNRWGHKTPCYKGMCSQTKKWKTLYLYGGLIVENITQAIARDILVNKLYKLDNEGFDIRFHVHDEIVCVCEENNAKKYHLIMNNIMRSDVSWAKNLPLEASGYISKFYRKD